MFFLEKLGMEMKCYRYDITDTDVFSVFYHTKTTSDTEPDSRIVKYDLKMFEFFLLIGSYSRWYNSCYGARNGIWCHIPWFLDLFILCLMARVYKSETGNVILYALLRTLIMYNVNEIWNGFKRQFSMNSAFFCPSQKMIKISKIIRLKKFNIIIFEIISILDKSK